MIKDKKKTYLLSDCESTYYLSDVEKQAQICYCFYSYFIENDYTKQKFSSSLHVPINDAFIHLIQLAILLIII